MTTQQQTNNISLEDRLVGRFATIGAVEGFLLGAYIWVNNYTNANPIIKEQMGGDLWQGYGMMSSGLLGAAVLGIYGVAIAYAANGLHRVVNRVL